MEEIYKIKYVDAYYIFENEIGTTKLSPHEAFGYVKKNRDNIIITFVKKVSVSGGQERANDNFIVKGLVIPDSALLSVSKDFKITIPSNLKESSLVAVAWRDVVYVGNTERRDCSVMYSEGILHSVHDDHIVLKNPETIRTYPAPVINHPSGKPTYYIIPKSFITDIKTTV